MTNGLFTGPDNARPRNAVMDVATPVMVRTPLGISSIYTPGKVGDTGIGILSLKKSHQHTKDRKSSTEKTSYLTVLGCWCKKSPETVSICNFGDDALAGELL